MSLLATALFAGCGVMLGRWLMKSAQKRPSENSRDADDANANANASPIQARRGPRAPSSPTPAIDLSAFPCQLGDVVLRAMGGEAWLAGALVFSDDAPTAVLFVAPEAGGDRAIFARARPEATLAWLEPLSAEAVAAVGGGPGGEPPTTLEHDGTRFERIRRLPVRVARAGSGAPDVGDRAILAEYAAAGGEQLVMLVGSALPHAWRGAALAPGMYDVLPGGAHTLGER